MKTYSPPSPLVDPISDVNGVFDEVADEVDALNSPGFDSGWTDIGLGVQVRFVWLSQELALELQRLVPEDQRNIRPDHYDLLKRDNEDGFFTFNGATIVISRSGKVIDGQHRIKVVAETGIGYRTLIVRNVPDSAFTSIDTTARRSGADAIKAQCESSASITAAVIGHIVRYREGKVHLKRFQVSPTRRSMAFSEHQEVERSVGVSRLAGRMCGHPSAIAFCHFIFSEIDVEAADEFTERLGTGAGMEAGNPILVLREKLRVPKDPKFPDSDIIHLTIKAWNAYRDGLTIRRIGIGPTEKMPKPK